MKTSHKIMFVFLSIITLGIFPLVINLKSKNQKTKNKLSISDKIYVNLEKIRKHVGGIENITGVEFTHTKVKIFIKERSLVDVVFLKSLNGVSGVFASKSYVTLIVGNSAKNIATKLLLS